MAEPESAEEEEGADAGGWVVDIPRFSVHCLRSSASTNDVPALVTDLNGQPLANTGHFCTRYVGDSRMLTMSWNIVYDVVILLILNIRLKHEHKNRQRCALSHYLTLAYTHACTQIHTHTYWPYPGLLLQRCRHRVQQIKSSSDGLHRAVRRGELCQGLPHAP